MTLYLRTAAMVLALITTLVVGTVVPTIHQVAIAQSNSALTSNPASVVTNAALGTTTQITLTIQNTGGADVTPHLYEALPISPTAALRAALPADLASVALPVQAQRVDPQLSATITASPNAPTDFLVFLADQADLRAAYTISDWNQRGQYVYQTLHDHAMRSQVGLRSFLDGRGVSYTPLWIVNALAVRGTAADVAALAGRSDVAMLRANHLMTLGPETPSGATLDQVSDCIPNAVNVCWNIERIGADRVWNNFGVRGAGITVASIDSGVEYTHPALVNQYRGNKGGGVFDHNYNWYNPNNINSVFPSDSGYHGTHTMGTMVASSGASANEPAVGVAPGARWIAARACDSSACTDTALIQAAQWMLAPTDLTGQNPRPDLRPHVINNSWSASDGSNNWYASFVTAWRASGIFPVFAAGNGRVSYRCSTIRSPADYAQVVGVGSLDSADKIAYYSDIGPSADGRLKPDISAPGSVIVSTAPGSGSIQPSYLTLSGTSMATPHVAGSVALIWSANPSLIGDYDRTYAILTTSASPIGADSQFDDPSVYNLCHATSTPNNIYGYGRLNVYSAVAQASVDVPWLSLPATGMSVIKAGASASLIITVDTRNIPNPGTYQARVLVHNADLSQTPLIIPLTLTVPADPNYATVSGKVTRASDGTPLAATVAVTDGATVNTDASGAYQLVLPSSAISYTLTANSSSYAPKIARMALGTSESATLNFTLNPDTPHLTFNTDLLTSTVSIGQLANLAITLHNDGTKAIDYSATMPVAWYGTWRSDQPDGPTATWINPPSSATTITLGDDDFSTPINIGFNFHFFDQIYTSVIIGANGTISFSPLGITPTGYASGCLPISESPNETLIPLHLDLDPSQIGARVSYAATSSGFLISWEDVPLFGTTTYRLSFQALLMPDGRVSMNYKQIGALPLILTPSAGVQQSTTQFQSLGCGTILSVSSGQTIELRPQPATTFWAALPPSSGSIAPGQQVDLPVTLSWVSEADPWPASVEILIASNDPLRPLISASARMTTVAAPFNKILPALSR